MAVEHLLGEERLVSRDGFTSWGGARYGVPWPYAGRRVVVKVRGPLVEIWALGKTEPVALHARMPGGGQTVGHQASTKAFPWDKQPGRGRPWPSRWQALRSSSGR